MKCFRTYFYATVKVNLNYTEVFCKQKYLEEFSKGIFKVLIHAFFSIPFTGKTQEIDTEEIFFFCR